MAATGQQGLYHPTGKNVHTEDLGPQHPAYTLVPETHKKILTQRTKMSFSRTRKNGGVGSQHQDFPSFKAFII